MSEKKKLRTKDLQEDFFEEIKSSDELDISLTISKSSSSSQVMEPIKDEIKVENMKDTKQEEVDEEETTTAIGEDKKDTT